MHADDNPLLFRTPPTILDVALEAGVSKSTVSNVVRDATGVSEATRRRVREAIERLGYRPNVIARQLVKRRTEILGVVVGDLFNPFFAEMAKMIERHAASRGYTAMFCNTEGDSQSEIEGVESLLEHRVAGIVFLAFSGESRAMREAVEQRVPVIFVACSGDAGDVVSVDDVQGGKLATEHLIAAGHRRIAYLSVPELEERSDLMRLQGYEDALRAAGLGPPIRISDFAGIYLQEFADRYHLRVPGDLSIVGFDDIAMSGLARIALTTVAQPREQLARLGIETLVARIEGKLTGPPQTRLVGVELVKRRSTAPLIEPAPDRT